MHGANLTSDTYFLINDYTGKALIKEVTDSIIGNKMKFNQPNSEQVNKGSRIQIRALTRFTQLLFVTLSITGLAACGSDDSEDADGYIKFYNASPNAPAIYLTVDEDVDADPDNEVEITYTSVRFGESTTNKQIPANTYTVELAWQEEDSTARADLTLLSQEDVRIASDNIHFVVFAGDIRAPQILSYEIPVIDDDEDDDLDLFNLRVFNITNEGETYDIYLSDSDETFNEAQLIGSFSPEELSDNQKFEQAQYVFYATLAGETEVVYQSSEVTFIYTTQYVLSVRDNTGVGSAPVVLDLISGNTTTNLPDDDSEARVRFFNGMQASDLLPNYSGSVNIYASAASTDPEITDLSSNQFSASLNKDNGDFSVRIVDASTNDKLFSNQLLSLPENTFKTIFYYIQEEAVDEDGDGNIDENDDGIVDAYKPVLRTLESINTDGSSIFEHQIKVVNLVDSQDFTRIKVYFVKSDEVISTAEANPSVVFGNQQTLYLRNNTYQVFAVAEIDGTDIILTEDELILDEDSESLFLILTESAQVDNEVNMQWELQTRD